MSEMEPPPRAPADPLLCQLVDDVGGTNALWFAGLLAIAERDGLTRHVFEFNTTDLLVDIDAQTSEIQDVLRPGSVLKIPLPTLLETIRASSAGIDPSMMTPHPDDGCFTPKRVIEAGPADGE